VAASLDEQAAARSRAAEGRGKWPLGPWALTVVVLTGQAMASLDSAIVNVAGPAIQRDLRLTGPGLQLAVYSYLLAYAIALVPGARLGDRYGYGQLFLLGVTVFTAGSLACGLAVSPVMLITARTIQGAGAALLVPQVLSVLQVTFVEGKQRRRAMSLYGLVLAIGVAAGQVLGGVLVTADLFGTQWRSVFLVNLPAGLAVLALGARRLPGGLRNGRARLDLAGGGVLAVAGLGLLVPLTFGADAGWPGWSWPALAVGLAALAVFVWHEQRVSRAGRHPLIDPALLTWPGIRSGLTGIFTLHASYGGLLFTTAVYLQHALRQSPLTSGLTFAGYAAGFAAAAVTWERLPASLHPRLPVAAVALFAATCGLLAWLARSGGWPWQATVLLVVAGLSHGTGFDVLMHRIVAVLPVAEVASASGVLATVNQFAIVTGIAVAGTIYLSAGMSAVLLTLAIALALTGAASAACTRPSEQAE
jgi:MFS family permease